MIEMNIIQSKNLLYTRVRIVNVRLSVCPSCSLRNTRRVTRESIAMKKIFLIRNESTLFDTYEQHEFDRLMSMEYHILRYICFRKGSKDGMSQEAEINQSIEQQEILTNGLVSISLSGAKTSRKMVMYNVPVNRGQPYS